MALTLKSPHGARNPHGFDYEGYLFAKGIRATASVRGTPRYLRDEPWANLSVAAQPARPIVRRTMQPYPEGKRLGAVLLALPIGHHDRVQTRDGRRFHLTGITPTAALTRCPTTTHPPPG